MLNKIFIASSLVIIFLIVAGCSPQATVTVPDQPPAVETATTAVPQQTTTAVPETIPVPRKQPEDPIKGTWIDVSMNGDNVSIPMKVIYDAWDTHFKIQDSNRAYTFMAYLWNNDIYVRANVCPPCRSIGFSLYGDILVCDTCRTTFEAETGAGIQGACVAFPKAPVKYSTVDNSIIMDINDLIAAYNKTQKG